MTDEVKFTNEQWDALAEAAEVFAETLRSEQAKLLNVISSNWAGECSEGVGIVENLRDLVRGDGGSFSKAVDSEANYLTELANQCRASKSVLEDADSSIQFDR